MKNDPTADRRTLHKEELYDLSQNVFLVIKSRISGWDTFGGLKCIQSFGVET
jgi:hypothetical protein